MWKVAKPRGDIEIGRRMAEEVRRLRNENKTADRIKVSNRLICDWESGCVPGGLMLAKLHSCGGDVLYVLTGKRQGKDG